MPILLTFECLIKGGISINIIIVILQVFITYGGLMQTQQIPYLIKIHCMAHKTNLAMQTLCFMPMVSILEDFL